MILSWPDKVLSPNARAHWRVVAKARREARREACYETSREFETAAGADHKTGKVRLAWTFYPPDNHKRDLDNLIASCKAYQDGIADALGVNDSIFVSTYTIGEVRPSGFVIVKLGGK